MDLGLQSRAAVVVGASKGIGKGVARSLAAEGCKLFILARNMSLLAETAGEIARDFGVEVTPVEIDVTDARSVGDAAATIGAASECINILVTSVGSPIRAQGHRIDFDEGEWSADLDIKVTGVLRVIKAFQDLIPDDGTGRIVNVTGASGVMTWMPAINYGMMNSAMIHATGYLAASLATRKITVNTVIPGVVGTEWRQVWAKTMAGEREPEEWLAEWCKDKGILVPRLAFVEEIGDSVAFLASDRAAYITGARLVVDGGVTANVRF